VSVLADRAFKDILGKTYIDGDDVSHRREGGETGPDLGPESSVLDRVRLDFESAF
jgi:hypothetical protein